MRGDDAHLPAGFIRECIVMGAFVLLVCVSLSASGVLRRADLLFFDIVQRLLLLRPSPHKIVLIAIDSASAHGSYTSNPAGGNVPPGASGSNSSAGCSGSVASGSNSTAVGNSSTASGNDSTALGAGSNDGGRSNVVAVGSADSARQVVNVAAGTQGTDAVNVNQLNAVSNQFTQSLNTVNKPAHADAAADPADRFDGARGIAATAGMASIPHMDRDSSFAMGGGTATFQGRKAMAVGVQARITENLKATVNVGFAGSQRVVGAGMLYQWK